MFKSRKTEQFAHERQPRTSIMKSFGGRFKKVFQKTKKAVRSQKHKDHPEQRVAHAQQSDSVPNAALAGQHTDEQEQSTRFRAPPLTESDLAVDFDRLSMAAQSQSSKQTSEEQASLEIRGLGEETKDRDLGSETAIEAFIDGPSDHPGIAKDLKDLHRQGLQPDYVLESNEAVQEDPRSTPASQSIPMSDREVFDSELDDGEDVANCLLSPVEVELKDSKWTDEVHKSPAALNVARRTGFHKMDIQDLYEELGTTEQLVVSEDRVVTPEAAYIKRYNHVQQNNATSQCFNPALPDTSRGQGLLNADENDRVTPGEALRSYDTPREDEVLLSGTDNFIVGRSRAFSGRGVDHEDEVHIKAYQIDSNSINSDSDGGVPVHYSELISDTPNLNASSEFFSPIESKGGPPPAAGIAVSGHCMAAGGMLPFSNLYVLKRMQRQSAPGALRLSHGRSNSETTLVDSPPLRPSPLESKFPFLRPSAPKNIAGGKQRLSEEECALRVEKAVKETREATDREWESANAATDLRHENELEDLKEDQQTIITDLQEKHQEDLKKVRKKHGQKIKNVRGGVARARSEKRAVEGILKNMTTERDVLRDELKAKNEQLERAIAAAQALQVNTNVSHNPQDVQSEHDVDMLTEPIYYDPLADPPAALNDQLEQLSSRFSAINAQLQDDLAQCQRTRDWYMGKSERYYKALAKFPTKNSMMELEEEKVELRLRLRECEAAISEEQHVRKVERKMFSDQVMIMREGIRASELDTKSMDLSRKAALAANEENIRKMRRPVSDNEIDAAIWELYRIVQADCQELRQNVEGHEHQKIEQAEEINVLKAKILQLELQGPRDEEQIHQLEADIRHMSFDYDTAIHERDIAIQDQEKREPELWRLIRDKPLRERDQKIARLEAQLRDRVVREDGPGPGTPFSIKKAAIVDGLTALVPGSTPGPLFGNEEATRPEDFATPAHGSCSSPIFGKEQVTQPRFVPTPDNNGSAGSDQADISFF